MRVGKLGLLLLGLLLAVAPLPAQQQCRKRILVYLDVSGSMQPKVLRASSPYQQVLLGLEQLFLQPGVIEENDAVTVVRFGKTVLREESAEGPAAAQALVQRLRGNGELTLETDFRAVFGHLASTLPQGVFNRQVALIASDFVHEPENRMPDGPAIADWQKAWTQAQENLSKTLADEAKFGLVLFQAPSSPAAGGRVARVLSDLRKNDAFVGLVPSSTDVNSTVQSLAGQLRKSLFNPPHLQISRDAEQDTRLTFTVTNPNCYPLHLTRLGVKPRGGEAVFFDVDADDRDLGPAGTPAATKPLHRDLPSGESWKAAEVRATVETAEGVMGEAGGTTASWLKFRPMAAVFERRPVLSDILRLDLDLTGYTDPNVPKVYTLTFGDDARPLARATFEAPAFTDLEPKPYRIVLPMKFKTGVAPDMRVAIEGADAIEAGKDRIALVEDRRASHGNRYLGLAALLAPLGVGFGFLWVRGRRAPYQIFQLSQRDLIRWGVILFLVLVLVLAFLLRAWILSWSSAEWADWWLDVTGVGLVFFLGMFLGLELSRAYFAAKVMEGESKGKPLSLESYIHRSRLNTGVPWLIGILVAIVLAVVLWPLRPPEARESRRSEAPAPLHVTSD